MATLGLLKIKVYLYKGYDAIIYVNDVANKISSHESNRIIDVVIWPNFHNFSIATREVIITSILHGFDQKNQLLWAVVLVHPLGMAFKFLGLIPTFGELTRGKLVGLGGRLFAPIVNRVNWLCKQYCNQKQSKLYFKNSCI